MRVFLDTNVLVSAFATRGLCAEVFRQVILEHELVVSELVLDELARVLKRRIHLPAGTIEAVQRLLREHRVLPNPPAPVGLPVRHRADALILTAAMQAEVDVIVTGDADPLDLGSERGSGDRGPPRDLGAAGAAALVTYRDHLRGAPPSRDLRRPVRR